MKIFILEDCPHCINLKRWIQELCEEVPTYVTIQMEYIDEKKQAELADCYDYYYVPSIFINEEKVHEGIASKEIIRKIFEQVKKIN